MANGEWRVGADRAIKALAAGLMVLLTMLWPAPAPAGELEQLLERVAAAGQRTRTLQAAFTQHKRMPLFRSEVASQGRLLFRQPGDLRWETFAPDAAVLLLRGERAELRIPGEPARRLDLKQGTALGSLVEQMLVWLGVRPASTLQRHYQVSLRQGGAAPHLRLVPRQAGLRKRVAAIDIWLDRDLGPSRIEVKGGEGELTRISFGAIRRNLPLADSLFR